MSSPICSVWEFNTSFQSYQSTDLDKGGHPPPLRQSVAPSGGAERFPARQGSRSRGFTRKRRPGFKMRRASGRRTTGCFRVVAVVLLVHF